MAIVSTNARYRAFERISDGKLKAGFEDDDQEPIVYSTTERTYYDDSIYRVIEETNKERMKTALKDKEREAPNDKKSVAMSRSK